MDNQQIENAAKAILSSKRCFAFTGAGISIESGIPPFRGENGLWSKYDPIVLDLDYFKANPRESWIIIKEIFYDFFGKARPNGGHKALARMEEMGIINSVVTQNIDNLHQEAGSKTVWEFHGNSHSLMCTSCGKAFTIDELDFDNLPVQCPSCYGLVKPDFIFFGEAIPQKAYNMAMEEATLCDLALVIGTTGEIIPASYVPHLAKQSGATIIEINPKPSRYTDSITDIYIQAGASQTMEALLDAVKRAKG